MGECHNQNIRKQIYCEVLIKREGYVFSTASSELALVHVGNQTQTN